MLAMRKDLKKVLFGAGSTAGAGYMYGPDHFALPPLSFLFHWNLSMSGKNRVFVVGVGMTVFYKPGGDKDYPEVGV
jgi:hypothetical protein